MVLPSLAAAIALALTGCGASGEDSQVASAAGASRPAVASPTTAAAGDVAAYLEGKRQWVKCLRAEGVEVSDPDATGTVKFPGSSEALKSDPKFLAAEGKCHSLLPPVPESVTELRKPKLSPEQIEVKRRYATCMQENGAPDYPDPGPDGYLSREQSWNPASSGAQRAMRACASIIGDPVDPPTSRG